nr:hypothetical protein [Mycobacterium sp. UM_NZ2]
MTRLLVGGAALTVVAAALLGASPASAAPTFTTGDLATRQDNGCSTAPGAGITPGHQCGPRDMRQWPFQVGTRCRGAY